MKKENKDNVVVKTTSQNKKKGKKKTGRKIFLVILIIIIALLAFFFYNVQKNGGGMKGIVTTVIGSSADKTQSLDDIYVLCLGQSGNMTDTMMVVKYSPKAQQISMLSIPRDSFVGTDKSKATAFDKINCKYQISPQTTLDAVNKLTGLNVKYYLTVDTKALRDLVDAIGGVEFDVPIDMDYDDSSQDLAIHLKKGYQKLNGVQAEGLVRFRHNNNGTSYSSAYGDNDYGRMRTQREFIKVVINQTMKPSNITKINELLDIANKEVDTNLSWDVIKDYIPALLNFNTENLRSDMLPGTAQYCNGVSIVIINTAKAKAKVQEMFLTDPETNSNGDENTVADNTVSESATNIKKNSEIKLEVLNGTGSNAKLMTAITQLQNQGYKITKKGTTNVTSTTLIIDRKNNTKTVENAIKSLLGAGQIKSADDNNGVDFTIILGQDY